MGGAGAATWRLDNWIPAVAVFIFAAMDSAGNKLYPGSTVTVKWKGGWYDGVVSKVGPQNHLLKVHYKSTCKARHLYFDLDHGGSQ